MERLWRGCGEVERGWGTSPKPHPILTQTSTRADLGLDGQLRDVSSGKKPRPLEDLLRVGLPADVERASHVRRVVVVDLRELELLVLCDFTAEPARVVPHVNGHRVGLEVVPHCIDIVVHVLRVLPLGVRGARARRWQAKGWVSSGVEDGKGARDADHTEGGSARAAPRTSHCVQACHRTRGRR